MDGMALFLSSTLTSLCFPCICLNCVVYSMWAFEMLIDCSIQLHLDSASCYSLLIQLQHHHFRPFRKLHVPVHLCWPTRISTPLHIRSFSAHAFICNSDNQDGSYIRNLVYTTYSHFRTIGCANHDLKLSLSGPCYISC